MAGTWPLGTLEGQVMNERLFDFVPSVFLKVLAATLGVLFVGWAGAIWLCGRLSTTDIVGSLTCVPIVAYLVHLWIIYARDHRADY